MNPHSMNFDDNDMRIDSDQSNRAMYSNPDRINSSVDHMNSNSNFNSNDTRFNSVNSDADNTARNVRDRNEGALTSFDQSESEKDRTISQTVRRALMNDSSLSTNAKNIKIITIDSIVTLRGPVNTAQEKAIIERIISQVAGIDRLDNQLEVLQQASR